MGADSKARIEYFETMDVFYRAINSSTTSSYPSDIIKQCNEWHEMYIAGYSTMLQNPMLSFGTLPTACRQK